LSRKKTQPRLAASSREKPVSFFIGVNNETLSVAAVCVSNEDRSPARIHG
jgi:hypothetical protein